MATVVALEKEHFVWAVGSLCKWHEKLFSADMLLRDFPPPHDVASLTHALRLFGLGVTHQSRILGGVCRF
jgi:ATP-binding cassette, subfamily B, bacterial HlyB/CyaB